MRFIGRGALTGKAFASGDCERLCIELRTLERPTVRLIPVEGGLRRTSLRSSLKGWVRPLTGSHGLRNHR